jgi:hypothetical protein
METDKRNELWNEFLKAWPADRIPSMRLEEYIQIGGKDTFAYWIEAKMESLGSIWGGSAFKFGIFQVDPSRKERAFEAHAMYKTDGEYAWYTRYGETRDEAYNTTKQLILNVIEAVRNNNLEAIGPMKMGRAIKWKIASLYQDHETIPITPIFDKKGLRVAADWPTGRVSTYQLMEKLKEMRGTAPFWEFYDQSVAKWHASKPKTEKSPAPLQNPIRYWLYAPGAGGKFWESFYREGVMAIGWDELGDLAKYSTRDDITTALQQEYGNGESSKANDSKGCWSFVSEIKPGDVIFAKIGRDRIIGRGVVTSEYRHEPGRESFTNVRNVEWQAKGEWKLTEENKFALKTITEVTRFPDFVKHVLDLTGGEADLSEDNEMEEEALTPSLNLILYGPPGTGKTYSLQTGYIPKYKALPIKSDEPRPIAFDQYNWLTIIMATLSLLGEKAKVGEILEHPLFLAKATALGRSTNLRSQIWGTLQTYANPNSKNVNYVRRLEPYVFDKLDDANWILLPDWKEADPEALELANRWTELNRKGSSLPAMSAEDRYVFVTFHQSYSYEDFIEGIRPETVDGELQYNARAGIFKRICAKAKADPTQKYAIFIDEINRGNIAKIFGELITLIEPDKRCEYDAQGNLLNKAIEVVLPYSGDRFGVPANLDIYGTMNTADRSIALLDIALRRRFRFQEVAPDPDIIKGEDGNGNIPDGEGGTLNLRVILDSLNKRLLMLRDRDHLLGHSFFVNCLTLEHLQDALRDQIIPLLQEYFYDDFGRIQKVFRDVDDRGNPYPDAIIRCEKLSGKDLFGSNEFDMEDRFDFRVSPSAEWTPSVIRRIYEN